MSTDNISLDTVLQWINENSNDTEAMNMIYLKTWKHVDVSASNIVEEYASSEE